MKKNQWFFVGIYVAFVVICMLLFQPLKGGFDDIYTLMNYFTIRIVVPVATLVGIASFIIYKKWWMGAVIGLIGGGSVLYTLFVEYTNLSQVLLVTTFGLLGSTMAFLVWKFVIRKVWK